LVQPITGLGNVVFHGRPFMLFIWQLPALLAPDAGIRGLFQEAHELGAKALLALIGLHAGAALFHGLVLRNGIQQRMLPLSIRINFLSARAGRSLVLFGIKSSLEESRPHTRAHR
jgi:cytochrome b561